MNPFFPSSMTPRPSNPVTMTEAWNHNINTPQLSGTRGGQRIGAFATVRSLESLAVVQKTPIIADLGGVKAYMSTLLVKGRA